MKEALVLVAHADDETLGAGGTITKIARAGWKVTVVVISDGLRFGGGGMENRSSAEAACQTLGVHELHFIGIPDQQFDTVPMATLTESVVRLDLAPDLIITNSDTDLNLDHRITCDVAKIIGRPRVKPISILSCEVPATSFWNGKPFPANYYVDITEHIDTKVEAFNQYVNEVRPFPSPWSAEGLRLLARYHGLQCGMPCAEAFAVIRGYEGLLPS